MLLETLSLCGLWCVSLHILFSSRLLNTAHGLSCFSISQFDFHALDMLYCRNIRMFKTSTVLFPVGSCSDLFAAGFSFFFFTRSIFVMDCQKTYLLPGQQDCVVADADKVDNPPNIPFQDVSQKHMRQA